MHRRHEPGRVSGHLMNVGSAASPGKNPSLVSCSMFHYIRRLITSCSCYNELNVPVHLRGCSVIIYRISKHSLRSNALCVLHFTTHTNSAYCCCETCPSAALPRCCLLVCFRGSPHPLECDPVRATVAAELNCPALWSNQKHTQQQLQWRRQRSISFERRHCREGLLPRKLGQLLLVKDCIWQADLDRCFHSEYCRATRSNTHPSHPLHSSVFHPLPLLVN